MLLVRIMTILAHNISSIQYSREDPSANINQLVLLMDKSILVWSITEMWPWFHYEYCIRWRWKWRNWIILMKESNCIKYIYCRRPRSQNDYRFITDLYVLVPGVKFSSMIKHLFLRKKNRIHQEINVHFSVVNGNKTMLWSPVPGLVSQYWWLWCANSGG
jgi:hypothetical protein